MKNEIDILTGLNKEQRSAAEYCDGPQLILAGAGSGKTRTLTHKIAYLCANGVKPGNILAITFTNKAAGEMKERIGKLVKDSKSITACTFHSLCNKLIREDASEVGFDRKFSIYTESNQIKVLKDICKETGNSDLNVFKLKSQISLLKNNMITPDLLELQLEEAQEGVVLDIYKAYNERLIENNALDFDDLLLYALDLLKNKDILNKWKKKFTHIFVDEFQDTNKPQFKLVTMLSEKNICVVGDDNQAIYGWRGSDIKYIIKFNEYFPSSKTFTLETNYRSTPTILKAASEIIDLNKFKTDKEIKANKKDNKYKIEVMDAPNEYDEAVSIVSEIQKLSKTYSYKDIAILYRTNMQSKIIEDMLRGQSIPYRIIGGLNFYDRKEIKDIIAFLSLINNPKDNIAFNRIVNFPPRGIGDKALTELRMKQQNTGLTCLEAAKEGTDALKQFYLDIKDAQQYSNKHSVSDLIKYILNKFNIIEYWENHTEASDIDRMGNIYELLRTASDDTELYLFLNNIIILSMKEEGEEDKDYITLMTAHGSKGLEYPIVFVTGLMEDLFPLPASSLKELEEERRLFYVALTRAMDKAYLTYSRSRYKFGRLTYYFKSHFIENISSKYLQELSYDY